MTNAVSSDELRQFIERIEHMDAEKRDLAEIRKECMAQAKGRGYDTGVIRALVGLRRKKPDEVAEFEAVLDLYKLAMGMA